MQQPRDVADPRDLFRACLRDPFGGGLPSHAYHWLRVAARDFPFWSFQPHAYARFQKSDLPSTYPLSVIANSVLRDEGLDESNALDALAADLDDRRRCLSTGEAYYVNPDDSGMLRLFPRSGWLALSEAPYRLAEWEPDGEHSVGGYVSPYENIGLDMRNCSISTTASRCGS